MSKSLTFKQQEFCKHYITEKGNGSRAYQKSFGPKKDSTARTEASRLLTYPNIIAEIERLKLDAEALTGISPASVVHELLSMANGSVRAFDSLDDLQSLSDAQKGAIKKLKRTRDNKGTSRRPVWKETIEVEFYSKLEIMSLIADILGYKKNNRTPVVVVNNNLFKDSEEEFQNAIEIL